MGAVTSDGSAYRLAQARAEVAVEPPLLAKREDDIRRLLPFQHHQLAQVPPVCRCDIVRVPTEEIKVKNMKQPQCV